MRALEVFQPPDGGVPEHVLRLSEGLIERGHEVTAAGPPDAAARPALEAAGARYVALPIMGDMVAPLADARALRALRALLGDGSHAVVHAHGQKAGVLGRLAALRAGVPALYTPHSFVYRTQLLRPRPGARARYRVSLAVERALGRRAAALVACARDERDAAVGDRVAPAERVHVVYYGVAPDRAAAPDPELVEFRGDGPLLGFVAGLRDQKGLPTLLDALEALEARRAAPRFAIVGSGPLDAEVRARVTGGPLATTTLVKAFGGRVEPHLAALDAFVLPSYWEGLPIAVLEAMAMGLPVVASAVNGTPEAVAEGETGFLVPSHNSAALADALERMAALAPSERTRMGDAGAAVARERFALPRMVDELAALYARISSRR